MTASTGASGTTTYGYDPAHRLTTRAPPAGDPTAISYNDQGQPSNISAGAVSVTDFYDFKGQLTGQLGNHNYTSYSYDADGRQTTAGTTTATYNADGQIATLQQAPPGNPDANTTTYTYDNAGRLATAAVAQNGTTTSTTSYSWDADSNRTKVAVSGLPDRTYHYNQADQLTSDSAGNTYGYNADGQLTSTGSATYSYGAFGDLTGAVTAGGTVSYVPDPLGRTATRTAGAATQAYSYDGTSTTLAAQQSGGTTTNLIRDPAAGTVLAETTPGGTTLMATPTIHGDLSSLTSAADGSTAWTAVYDPFGTATTTGSAPASLAFQSMPTDPATGLTDMGARSYDPATGTFTSADTIAGSLQSPVTLNRYLYGDANPVTAYDPDGHWPWSSWWNDAVNWLAQTWDTITTAWDAVTNAWDTVTHAAGQAWNTATQAVDTARQVAADAAHTVTQIAHAIGPALRATAASVVVGGAVFLGCEALTAGAGSVACATAAWTIGGAVYGAMTCPPGTPTLHCALNGGLAGAAAGLTAGLGAELGLGAATAGALSGAAGNAASQYLTTGHINPAQLLTSAALGAATFRLASTITGTATPEPADPAPDTTATPRTPGSEQLPAPAPASETPATTPADTQPATEATRTPSPEPRPPSDAQAPEAGSRAIAEIGPAGNAGAFPDLGASTSSLQHTFSNHAADFGFTGNWSKATGSIFEKALADHVGAESTLSASWNISRNVGHPQCGPGYGPKRDAVACG